jgi:hypothetical protein
MLRYKSKREACHAAVLALVGWLLMAPPRISGSDKYDTRAALSHLKTTASFHNAARCCRRRKALIHEFAAATLPWPEELRKQGITVQEWIAGQRSGIDEFVHVR